MLYLALAHPVVFFVVLALSIALAAWLLPKLWRFVRGFVARVWGWFGHGDTTGARESRHSGDV